MTRHRSHYSPQQARPETPFPPPVARTPSYTAQHFAWRTACFNLRGRPQCRQVQKCAAQRNRQLSRSASDASLRHRNARGASTDDARTLSNALNGRFASAERRRRIVCFCLFAVCTAWTCKMWGGRGRYASTYWRPSARPPKRIPDGSEDDWSTGRLRLCLCWLVFCGTSEQASVTRPAFAFRLPSAGGGAHDERSHSLLFRSSA